jgi:hypothetical protein
MQEPKEEITLAEPLRDPLNFRLDTPDQLEIVRKISALREEAGSEAQQIRERQMAEQQAYSERYAERNKELFGQLLGLLGVETSQDELETLMLDTEYLDQHGIAFLKEERECPNCGGEGGGLAALLGGLAGGGRTHF